MGNNCRRGIVAVITASTIWSLSGSLVPGSPIASQTNAPEHQYAGWEAAQQKRGLDEAASRSAAEAAARLAATEDVDRAVASDLVRP